MMSLIEDRKLKKENVFRGSLEATKLLINSSKYYFKYFVPVAYPLENPEIPILHFGHVESAGLTLALNTLGVKERELKKANSPHILRAIFAFTYLCNIYDIVVDTAYNKSITVSEDQLDNTTVTPKYSKKEMTASSVYKLILESLNKAFSTDDKRIIEIVELINSYKNRILSVANDPKYRSANKNTLSFEDAFENKMRASTFCGETAIAIVAKAFGINDPEAIKMYGHATLLAQFGDDRVDWRDDLREYIDAKSKSNGEIKPAENLFLATLEEFPDEKLACEKNLNTNIPSSQLIQQLAPKALAQYVSRFNEQLKIIPPHKFSNIVANIVSFGFYQMIPLFNEFSNLAKWMNIRAGQDQD